MKEKETELPSKEGYLGAVVALLRERPGVKLASCPRGKWSGRQKGERAGAFLEAKEW